MSSPGWPCFERCNLREMGSAEIILLSRCWREDRIRMTHHPDETVDISLKCELAVCACARALSKMRSTSSQGN